MTREKEMPKSFRFATACFISGLIFGEEECRDGNPVLKVTASYRRKEKKGRPEAASIIGSAGE